MDLIFHINSREALEAALRGGVAGVKVGLPLEPEEAWWTEAGDWQAAARKRSVSFSLQWDGLIKEADLDRGRQTLAAVAAFSPDALILRDPGICREARRQHPGLTLHASRSAGFHNSPGLRLAAALGFSRVVLSGPLHLKDLALLGRQATLPLEVVLPQPCPGYGHLCLLDEYPASAAGCPACGCPSHWHSQPAASLLAALELLPGLAQLGVGAVHLGGVFSRAEPLGRLLELFSLVEGTSPAERPRFLAAAGEVLMAFGTEFRLEFPPQEPQSAQSSPLTDLASNRPHASQERPHATAGPGRIWLEARNHSEAAALARDWREPLLLALTPEDYAAFLAQYRHWRPRQLIWRLPAVIRESALPFLQQAVATLKQGGFSRFLAGDWGAVALVGESEGTVLGDQTLGVRNSQALAAAQELGVSRVCLPPGQGPQDWQDLVRASERGSFWGYLYHLPVLAACPDPGDPAAAEPDAAGENLRWHREGDLALLTPESPIRMEQWQDWFERHWVAPLLVSLPNSGLTWGQVPTPARPPRPEKWGPGRAGPRGSGRGPGKRGPGFRDQGSEKPRHEPPQSRGRVESPPPAKPRRRRQT